MPRPILALAAAVALVAAACGDDDGGAAGTTTTAHATPTSEPTTTSAEPGEPAGWVRCENPDGFSVAHPAEWETNAGSVVGPCSQFDPDPFEVPAGTDERVAAITAYVDPVPFHQVAGPERGSEQQRALTTVDGHQAVRTEGPSGELYPDDATAVRYTVDLSLGIDDADGTLFLDTIELSGADFERNVAVLDRMARTVELAEDDEPDTTVVARFEGGGNLFSAGGSVEGDERCVAAPLDAQTKQACFVAPAADEISVADLSGELFPLLAGVTGADVFRVEVRQAASTTSYLPVRIEGTDTRGFALPSSPPADARISWYAIDGDRLGSRAVEDVMAGRPQS